MVVVAFPISTRMQWVGLSFSFLAVGTIGAVALISPWPWIIGAGMAAIAPAVTRYQARRFATDHFHAGRLQRRAWFQRYATDPAFAAGVDQLRREWAFVRYSAPPHQH